MGNKNWLVSPLWSRNSEDGRHQLAEDLDEILERLFFKELPVSQVPDWRVLTRERDEKEFAAIHADQGYIITGNYSDISVPQQDLDVISRYVFNEGYVSWKLRKGTALPMFTVPTVGLGATFYDITHGAKMVGYVIENIQEAIPDADRGMISMGIACTLVGSMVAVGVATAGAGKLLTMHYASKLSPEAENYRMNIEAEGRLRTEWVYDQIRFGKMSKAEFFELNGVE